MKTDRLIKVISAVAFALSVLPGCVPVKANRYTLDDVQGYWWQSCDDPAVQFAIQDNRYSGDFEGEFAVRVENDLLIVIRNGDSNTAYRILAASPERLLLQSVIAPEQDWLLRSCPSDPN